MVLMAMEILLRGGGYLSVKCGMVPYYCSAASKPLDKRKHPVANPILQSLAAVTSPMACSLQLAPL